MVGTSRWCLGAILCLAVAGCGDDSSGVGADGTSAASSTGTTNPASTDPDSASAGSTTNPPTATVGPTTGSAAGTADPDSTGESVGSTTTGDESDTEVAPVDCSDFPGSIDTESLMAHLAELQAIGDEHGNRSVGTPGYEASADYVRLRLEAAGYNTAVDQNFEVAVYEELSPTLFSSGDPLNVSYALEQDFYTARYSGAGTVTAAVYPIDVELGLDNMNTSGCQDSDFDGFGAGAIALIQRGGCTFASKVNRATTQGAAGVIIFNRGHHESQEAPFVAGIDPDNPNPPTVIASYAVGEALALAANPQATIDVDAVTEDRTTRNILVERTGTDPSQVVMFGAHLDSVPEGPGINDNGTGSMAMLAIAERLAQCDPARTVRFAWWGAEEIGLLGSSHYVENLAETERQALLFYLNFDMIGSPNFVRFVHDGDGSRYGNAGAPGSDTLELFFHEYFADQGLPLEEARFDGRSDYGPFLDFDIPSGGLFTGAEQNKSGPQAKLYGGEQGEPYDPCYHRACDVVDTIAVEEYARVTVAVAAAVARFGLEGDGLFSRSIDPPVQTYSQSQEHAGAVGCGHGFDRQ